MKHNYAKKIFTEIRNRPYAWTSQYDSPTPNCYYKTVELLQRLAVVGYTVRGKIGETYLSDTIPEEIRTLYPEQYPLTHYWVELQLDNHWYTLDPSFDPALANAGLNVCEWESGTVCFDITKVYSISEQISYRSRWEDKVYAREYFNAIGPCSQALNEWFERFRK